MYTVKMNRIFIKSNPGARIFQPREEVQPLVALTVYVTVTVYMYKEIDTINEDRNSLVSH